MLEVRCGASARFLVGAALVFGLASGGASAQMVGSDQAQDSADMSRFGQSSAFENSTTEFDNVNFTLRAFIRDPADDSKLRAIVQVESSNAENIYLIVRSPFTSAVDDFANIYRLASVAGIGICEYGSLSSCNDGNGSLRLVAGLPAPLSFVFEADQSGGFQPELAAMAQELRLSVTFAISRDRFEDRRAITQHEVQIVGIPIPE